MVRYIHQFSENYREKKNVSIMRNDTNKEYSLRIGATTIKYCLQQFEFMRLEIHKKQYVSSKNKLACVQFAKDYT